MEILFLCATNAILSPMAESLLRRIDSENFQGVSAGFERLPAPSYTTDLLKTADLQLADWSPSPLSAVIGQKFDIVITMGERAPSLQSVFPNVEHIHWRFDDPSLLDADQIKDKLVTIRDQIAQRIRLLVLVHMRWVKQSNERAQALPQVS